MLLFTLHAMLLSLTAIALLHLLALQALAAPLGFDNSLAVFTLPVRMRARTFNLAVSTTMSNTIIDSNAHYEGSGSKGTPFVWVEKNNTLGPAYKAKIRLETLSLPGNIFAARTAIGIATSSIFPPSVTVDNGTKPSSSSRPDGILGLAPHNSHSFWQISPRLEPVAVTSKAPFRLQMNGSVKGDLVFKANFTPEVWTPMAGDGFSSWAASGTLNGVAFENAQLDVASEGIEMDVESATKVLDKLGMKGQYDEVKGRRVLRAPVKCFAAPALRFAFDGDEGAKQSPVFSLDGFDALIKEGPKTCFAPVLGVEGTGWRLGRPMFAKGVVFDDAGKRIGFGQAA